MDKQVEQLMELLGCSEEQAKQVINDDKAIDKMTVSECESDLSQEQKATAKKARQGDRKPTMYNFSTRERKVDTDKAHLIHLLADCLSMVTANENDLTVTNAERQIDFVYNGRKFRVILSCPRN